MSLGNPLRRLFTDVGEVVDFLRHKKWTFPFASEFLILTNIHGRGLFERRKKFLCPNNLYTFVLMSMSLFSLSLSFFGPDVIFCG